MKSKLKKDMELGDNDGDDDFLMCGGDHHDSTDHHHSSRAVIRISLLIVVIGLTCLVMNQRDYPTQLVQESHSFSLSHPYSNPKQSQVSSSFHDEFKSEDLTSYVNDENNLARTLKRAAMKDHKTVILTTINAAWVEPNSIFDLFLESFRIGDKTRSLLKHLIVVAWDQKAYSRCRDVHRHCLYLTADDGVDFSDTAYFMSHSYLKMMWRRIDFLRSVLEMGYNFVFSDADIMWLRDPFPRFYPDGDFQIACDRYNHNSTDMYNYPNGGFTHVRSNNRTIRFYKFWHASKDDFPGKHDQDVFDKIKFDPFITEIGLRVRFLDTAYFGGFCESSKNLDLVVTMHANCCVGLGFKIHDIKMVMEDWKKYMALSVGNEKKVSRKMTWTVPRECGWMKINSNH